MQNTVTAADRMTFMANIKKPYQKKCEGQTLNPEGDLDNQPLYLVENNLSSVCLFCTIILHQIFVFIIQNNIS